MYTTIENDTICAVSTPSGVGGIAVVRVSGPEAIGITDRIWRGKSLREAASHTAHLGEIVEEGSNDEPLDQAVATVFRGPNSYTGEDVVELSVHGSRWIQRELVNLLIRTGCRLAEPGEFTRRAFASGRLVLAQAEAVADVIASSSRSAHRLASSQMRGVFSKNISALRDELIRIASLLELELDFSEEEVEFASREELMRMAEELLRRISGLAYSFSTGNAIKEGVPVAIVGEPNVGKSTLLNRLLNDNRAIVSDIPGTTRDTIEDTVEIDGVMYRFIDTAGIRQTDDMVESMGIERTLGAVGRARIVVWIVTPDVTADDFKLLATDLLSHLPEDAKMIVAVNKIDKINGADKTAAGSVDMVANSEIVQEILPANTKVVYISAANDVNIDELEKSLRVLSGADDGTEADMIVTNARHYEALVHARESLLRVIDGIQSGISGDFIAQDLRETIHHLGTITGTITTTDILTSIFQNFCIGK